MKYSNFMKLLALTAMFSLSCGTKSDPVVVLPQDDNSSGDGSATAVSYAADVKPILDLYCIGCHSSQVSGAARNGAPLPVNFDSYEAAAANAGIANSRIQSGSMPPGGSVPAIDKIVVQLWVSEGAPQ